MSLSQDGKLTASLKVRNSTPSGSLTQGSKPLRRTRKHRRRAKAPDPLALRRRDHGEPSRDTTIHSLNQCFWHTGCWISQ
jgi:hypothetical protein